jgi:hypothetical protein
MPPRRSTTAEPATPLEETGPTAPAAPAPSPVEPEPTAEELDDRARDDDEPPLTYSRVATMIDGAIGDALSDVRRGPFGLVTAQREDYPLTVHEAIAEVTRRIGAIEKTGRSTEGYRFRGIDQALAALHPILGDVGLVIVPGQVIRESWETRATAKGGTLNVARLLVRYTFVGPDGSKLRAAAWGEGADSGDKATQKAHSQSYKTLVFQAFTIPTETSAEDEPDAANPSSRPFTADEIERAGRAYDAALNAATLDALAGVRHRALALLDVPVPMADGGAHPLSLLFESRRAAIERPLNEGS